MSFYSLESRTTYERTGSQGHRALTENGGADALAATLIVDAVAIADAVIIICCAIVAKYLYIDWFLEVPSHLSGIDKTIIFAELGVVLAVICFFVFRYMGLYRPSHLLHSPIRIGLILFGLGASFLILIAILFLLKSSAEYSRGWFLIWFPVCTIFLIVERAMLLSILRRAHMQDALTRKVAIYGSGAELQRIRDALAIHSPDLNIVGLYSSEPDTSPIDLSGDLKALISLGQKEGCDEAIIALPLSAKTQLQAAIAKLSILPIDLVFLPVDLVPLADLCPVPVRLHDGCKIGNLPAFMLLCRPLTHRQYLAKTAADVVLSGVALILLAPLFALIAIAIKLDSSGPVFFLQRRHGYNHKLIRVAKFRTMKVLEDSGEIKQAMVDDARVTRVGRFLRRTSLDELPQLWNVMIGEMSLVGPRPHALSHNEYYGNLWSEYSCRHRVKPGITGWAQVSGLRGEIFSTEDMRKRAEHDVYYIENWSLWFDIKILLITVATVFIGKNAY